MTIKVGHPVPDFTAPSTLGDITLSLLKGHIVVLYFYPKDNTPGCTLEGQNFRDLHAEFVKHDVAVLGISRDSIRSHMAFCEQEKFPFPLVSDVSEQLTRAFDVIKTKTMYGKPVQGVERSTFVIDQYGVLVKEWRAVKVPGHAQEVLDYVQSL